MVLLNVSSCVTTLRIATTAPVIGGNYKMASKSVQVREGERDKERGGRDRKNESERVREGKRKREVRKEEERERREDGEERDRGMGNV